jgi:hypothetical protein
MVIIMKKIIVPACIWFLASCSTAQPKQFVILKYTWNHCIKACGKKDNLAAVSSTDCICTNGNTIPLQTNQSAMIQEPSFFDRLIAFINGEQI